MGKKSKRVSKATKRIHKIIKQVREKKLRVVNYKITNNAVIDPNFDSISEQDKSRITEIHKIIKTESAGSVIPELIRFIKKYPNVPILRNYLGVAYFATGQTGKLEEAATQLYIKFPDYLFARLNYAQICLMRKEYDKIPEILGHTFDLKELYPDRDEFHISEFVTFAGIVGEYRFYTGNREQAQRMYELLKDIAPDDQNTDKMKYLLS